MLYIIVLSDKQNLDKTIVIKNSISNLYNLIILDNYDHTLKNLSKIFKIYDYLKNSNTIKNDDIICIIDGHDVIYNKLKHPLDNLSETFVKQKKDVIFSCETKFSHHDTSVKDFFDLLSTSKNKYLNSGCILTYKWACLKMFGDIINNIHIYNIHISKSDQRVLSLYMKNNYNTLSMSLDYNNLFCTTVNTEYNQDLEDINSYFIHVTFLKNQSQQLKYDTLCKINNIHT